MLLQIIDDSLSSNPIINSLHFRMINKSKQILWTFRWFRGIVQIIYRLSLRKLGNILVCPCKSDKKWESELKSQWIWAGSWTNSMIRSPFYTTRSFFLGMRIYDMLSHPRPVATLCADLVRVALQRPLNFWLTQCRFFSVTFFWN